MATGGDRKAVCRLSATSSPKNSGSTPKLSSSGMKMGMKITMISVHSSGQPRMKMITCDRIRNSVLLRFIESTQRSTSSWPPSSAKAAEKIAEPTNSQHTIAEVLAVRNTDSRTVGSSFTWKVASTHQIMHAAMETQPTHAGGALSTTSNSKRMNQRTATSARTARGAHVRAMARMRSLGSRARK